MSLLVKFIHEPNLETFATFVQMYSRFTLIFYSKGEISDFPNRKQLEKQVKKSFQETEFFSSKDFWKYIQNSGQCSEYRTSI